MQKIDPDNFCIFPWIHLHVSPNGKCTACCQTTIPYGDIKEKSLMEIWTDTPLADFRKRILQGIKDKRCSACFSLEEGGTKSLRQEFNEHYYHLINENFLSDKENYSRPVYLDVRFSNLCNFKCRTCWHGNSSKWFEDAQQLKRTAAKKSLIKSYNDYSSFFMELQNLSPYIQEFYFAGGEPLIMDEHYDLLHFLAENKLFHIKLRYNTNLSHIHHKDYKLSELWKDFKDVRVSVSIDHIGKQAELIRAGLNWEQFQFNLNQIMNMLPNVRVIINPTVSVLNISELDKIHRFFIDEMGINVTDFSLNILKRPYYYCVQSLDERKKDEVVQLLNEHMDYLEKMKAWDIIKQFSETIIFMRSKIGSKNKDFLKETRELDLLRKENLSAYYCLE